jgi:hypothetical protein
MILDLSKSAGRDIRIAVTRAARVRGFIRTRADASADEERLAMFLRNAIVELSQGSDAHRRTVDGTGEFSFDGLRPGTWQLRVVNELPTDYAFADHTIQKLDLKAGEAREVTLELQRKDRPLKLMKEKELPTVQLESH